MLVVELNYAYFLYKSGEEVSQPLQVVPLGLYTFVSILSLLKYALFFCLSQKDYNERVCGERITRAPNSSKLVHLRFDHAQ